MNALRTWLTMVPMLTAALLLAEPLPESPACPGPGDEGYLAVLTGHGDGMTQGDVVELQYALGNGNFQVCIPRGTHTAVVPARSLRKLPLAADASAFDLTQALIAAMLSGSADWQCCRALAERFAPGDRRLEEIARFQQALQELRAFRLRARSLSAGAAAARVRKKTQTETKVLAQEELDLLTLEGEIGGLYTQILEPVRMDAAEDGDFYLAFLVAERGGAFCLEIADELRGEFPDDAGILRRGVEEDRALLVAEYRGKAEAWRCGSCRVAAYRALYPQAAGLWNSPLPRDYAGFRKQIKMALQARERLQETSALAQGQEWGGHFLNQNAFLPLPDGGYSFTPEYDRIFDAACARESRRRAPETPGVPAASGTSKPKGS